MNNVIIVGRLASEIEEKETSFRVVLAVSRPFKNEYGDYETDFIDVRCLGNVGETTKEYCRKGDLLGVKGRIQTETIETDDFKRKISYVLADKITFLSQARKEDE